MSISVVLKAITINGMKKKSSVFIGKNSVVWSSYQKTQEGIATSSGENHFRHSCVCFFDNDGIDTIIYKKPRRGISRKKRRGKRRKVPAKKQQKSRKKAVKYAIKPRASIV